VTKKIIAIFIIIILGIILLWPKPKTQSNLGSSKTLGVTDKEEPTTTEVIIDAPKTFKFDRSTDLEMELDSINPQILDSDFE